MKKTKAKFLRLTGFVTDIFYFPFLNQLFCRAVSFAYIGKKDGDRFRVFKYRFAFPIVISNITNMTLSKYEKILSKTMSEFFENKAA